MPGRLWFRYQSKSELSLWYYDRVGDLKGRVCVRGNSSFLRQRKTLRRPAS
jgi:hypothetical protein